MCQICGTKIIGLYYSILSGNKQRRQILILQVLCESHLDFLIILFYFKYSNPILRQKFEGQCF